MATARELARGAPDQISDAELLERQFSTDDPESLPNLTLEVPATDEMPVIEFAYNVTPPKGERRALIRCAHCRYPNHWRGYVMRCRDARQFLVGKDCGAKIYGANFEFASRTFDDRQSRQRYVRRLMSVRAAFPALLRSMYETVEHLSLAMYMECRRELHNALPGFCQGLAKAFSYHAGALAVTEKVRDYAAEERRAEAQKDREERERRELTVTERKKRRSLRKMGLLPDDEDNEPIYKTLSRPVGRVVGGELFRAKVNPKRGLVECHERLKAMFHEIGPKETDEFTLRQLQNIMRELREILDRIDSELDALDAVPAFFDGENLSKVVVWASYTAQCHGEFRVHRSTLVVRRDQDVEDVRFSMPKGYQAPSREAFEEFREAMKG